VLNTIIEHDFQDAFRKWYKSAGNGAYRGKGTTSKTCKSKVSFDEMAAPVPEMMDDVYTYLDRVL
jgi:hypothetical protein